MQPRPDRGNLLRVFLLGQRMLRRRTKGRVHNNVNAICARKKLTNPRCGDSGRSESVPCQPTVRHAKNGG